MYSDNTTPFFELPASGNADAVPASGSLGNSTYPAKLSCPMSLDIWADGSLVQTRRLQNNNLNIDYAGKRARGPRGQVDCLTSNARRRLSATVAMLRRSVTCHFITLTYAGLPENWDPSFFVSGPPVPLPGPRQAKQELRAYFKWIRYQYPDFAAVWKLEPQERGVPHFHLLAYGLPDDADVMDSLRSRWHAIAGRGQDAHLVRGFEADYLGADADKARAYVSKYVAKGDALLLNPDHGPHAGLSPGRFWGLEFRESLPFSDCFTMEIDPDFSAFAIRTLRRMQQAKMRQSFLARVSKFTDLHASGVHDLKTLRFLARRWSQSDAKRWQNFPKYRDPFRFVPLLRNNFTKDPREFVSRLLDAVTVAATHSPPDHLAGPLGSLP